jgi:hypothetical protein
VLRLLPDERDSMGQQPLGTVLFIERLHIPTGTDLKPLAFFSLLSPRFLTLQVFKLTVREGTRRQWNTDQFNV